MKPLAIIALAAILTGIVTPARAADSPPCAGCAYHFTQLVMPADRFKKSMLALFDNQLTFDALTSHLDEQRIFYSLGDICMGLTEFPANVQKALAGFGPGDNLIGKAGGSLLILKIQRLHPSRRACLGDLPARPSRDTGAKRPAPSTPNASAGL